MTFELQQIHGKYAKGIFIELTQSGDNIIGRRLLGGYRSSDKYGQQTIFLLAKSPITINEIMKLGIKIDKLIIGCTDLLGEGHKLSDRAYVTDEELQAMREIRDKGCKIVVQHNPQTPQVDAWTIVK